MYAERERERIIFYQILDRIRLRLYNVGIPWQPSTGRHRNEFLGCLGGTVLFIYFFFMNLSAVNKRAEQTVLNLYKYVGGVYKYVGGGGGRGGGQGPIIVSGSKHACLIISCNILIFILPISLLLTKSPKYPISFAATPIPETLMQASAVLAGSRVRFPTEVILLVIKNLLSLQFWRCKNLAKI